MVTRVRRNKKNKFIKKNKNTYFLKKKSKKKNKKKKQKKKLKGPADTGLKWRNKKLKK
jgi:hypothetical protein